MHDDAGHHEGFIFVNGNKAKALDLNTAQVLCVDGGHVKNHELKGMTLLIAASMNGNGKLVALGYQLCLSESKVNIKRLMDVIQDWFPGKFANKSTPVRLTARHYPWSPVTSIHAIYNPCITCSS